MVSSIVFLDSWMLSRASYVMWNSYQVLTTGWIRRANMTTKVVTHIHTAYNTCSLSHSISFSHSTTKATVKYMSHTSFDQEKFLNQIIREGQSSLAIMQRLTSLKIPWHQVIKVMHLTPSYELVLQAFPLSYWKPICPTWEMGSFLKKNLKKKNWKYGYWKEVFFFQNDITVDIRHTIKKAFLLVDKFERTI